MIIGHQRQIRYLTRVLGKGAIAHAYLFAGPEAVGKKTIAVAFAKGLFCERSPLVFGGCLSDRQAGGVCPACRGAERLTHPDIIFLAPDRPVVPEEGKKGIGIRNIQEISRRLAFAPWAGGWRVVLIDGAEAMSREAQSALLKSLEEPRQKTLFLLIAAAPGALLETIRSRCVPVHFSLLSDATLREGIAQHEQSRHGDAQSVVALSRGRPGLAMRLAREQEFFRESARRESEFAELLHRDPDEQFRSAEAIAAERDRLEAFFGFALHALRGRLGSQHEERRGLRSLLETTALYLTLLTSTAVNRRLLADAFFVELHALRNTNQYEFTNA